MVRAFSNSSDIIKCYATSVNIYQQHMDSCKTLYVEALCDEFVYTCIREESTIDVLDGGWNTFHKSLNNYIEFKNFCKSINHHHYNTRSRTYLRVFRNTFKEMRKEYNDPSILKSFANQHSTLGLKLNEFMKQCTKWYIDCSLVNHTILCDKSMFLHFCTTINSNRSRHRQVNMTSNLFKVYFDDSFCNLCSNAKQIQSRIASNPKQK